ncbi:MAG TPA: hypothetical protein VME01_09330 [Solirubrobacteraceae bacterium]|nr:hypothetical protein [Solirubrobacteraceae bacterium]
MSTIAADKLHELDEDIRHAWQEYHEYLHDLRGQEYHDAEPEAWELLQEELQDIEARRRILTTPLPEHVAD